MSKKIKQTIVKTLFHIMVIACTQFCYANSAQTQLVEVSKEESWYDNINEPGPLPNTNTKEVLATVKNNSQSPIVIKNIVFANQATTYKNGTTTFSIKPHAISYVLQSHTSYKFVIRIEGCHDTLLMPPKEAKLHVVYSSIDDNQDIVVTAKILATNTIRILPENELAIYLEPLHSPTEINFTKPDIKTLKIINLWDKDITIKKVFFYADQFSLQSISRSLIIQGSAAESKIPPGAGYELQIKAKDNASTSIYPDGTQFFIVYKVDGDEEEKATEFKVKINYNNDIEFDTRNLLFDYYENSENSEDFDACLKQLGYHQKNTPKYLHNYDFHYDPNCRKTGLFSYDCNNNDTEYCSHQPPIKKLTIKNKNLSRNIAITKISSGLNQDQDKTGINIGDYGSCSKLDIGASCDVNVTVDSAAQNGAIPIYVTYDIDGKEIVATAAIIIRRSHADNKNTLMNNTGKPIFSAFIKEIIKNALTTVEQYFFGKKTALGEFLYFPVPTLTKEIHSYAKNSTITAGTLKGNNNIMATAVNPLGKTAGKALFEKVKKRVDATIATHMQQPIIETTVASPGSPSATHHVIPVASQEKLQKDLRSPPSSPPMALIDLRSGQSPRSMDITASPSPTLRSKRGIPSIAVDDPDTVMSGPSTSDLQAASAGTPIYKDPPHNFFYFVQYLGVDFIAGAITGPLIDFLIGYQGEYLPERWESNETFKHKKLISNSVATAVKIGGLWFMCWHGALKTVASDVSQRQLWKAIITDKGLNGIVGVAAEGYVGYREDCKKPEYSGRKDQTEKDISEYINRPENECQCFY